MAPTIKVAVDLNPPTVAAARSQWRAALAAAERAESIYNAAIERAAETVADMAARPPRDWHWSPRDTFRLEARTPVVHIVRGNLPGGEARAYCTIILPPGKGIATGDAATCVDCLGNSRKDTHDH